MTYHFPTLSICIGLLIMATFAQTSAAAPTGRSHTTLRPAPTPSDRPMAKGPGLFVDAKHGDDANDGSEKQPWKTINHAMLQVKAGDTVYLRGGSYFENVYCAIKGLPDKPITIRSYPGELAVIDGGLPEFQNQPETAWQPVKDGAPGEFVSTNTFKNQRDMVGGFGDSNIGLQTYWYLMDLQSQNELWIDDPKLMAKPVWCGPGLWYDKDTGRIHIRLAHTNVKLPDSANHEMVNYKGETDPRNISLVVAPFDSTPLHISQAMHVKFEDLVVRGGGYVSVKMNFGVDITFDRVTIYCGTYGLLSKSTGPFHMVNSSIRGTIQPWVFRGDTALYSYDGRVYPPFVGGNEASAERAGTTDVIAARPVRHITRMNSHALLITEGFYEYEVFAHPFNHDWEVTNCEFTDGHDGVYLSGRVIKFHHNWVANMQDDGIYISGPTPYVTDKLYVYQNVISTVVSVFAMHGRGGPGGDIYIFRNIVDQRGPIQYVRPSPERPQGYISDGSMIFFTHGKGLHQENMHIYQNTCLVPVASAFGAFAGGMTNGLRADTVRQALNNIYLYYPTKYFDRTELGYPGFRLFEKDANAQFDGNIHWHLFKGDDAPKGLIESVRNHPLAELNKKRYPDGWAANSFIADPKLIHAGIDRTKRNDFRLAKDSPAIGKGVTIPSQWPDPLRPANDAKPDIGAMPADGKQLNVGVDGRIEAGTLEALGYFPR